MLHNLQKDFVEYALHRQASNNLLANIKGEHKLDKLALYVNNFTLNCINALKVACPNTIKLVGDEYFDFIAKQFVLTSPPKESSLLRYGENFPNFLSTLEQLEPFPFITDFAKLEWLMHLSHHAQTKTTIGIDALTNPEIQLVSTAYIISSKWDLPGIYKTCETMRESEYNFKKEVYILVHRPDWKVILTPLSILDYELLNAISHGISLENIAETFSKTDALPQTLLNILNLKVLTVCDKYSL